MDLLASVLAAGKNSRLYKSLVYEQQHRPGRHGVPGGRHRWARCSASSVTAKPRHTLAEIERAIDAELARLRRDAADSAGARAGAQRHRDGVLQDPRALDSRADTLNTYEYFFGDPGALERDLARYRAATPDERPQVARAGTCAPRRALTVRVEPGKLAGGRRRTAAPPAACAAKPLPPPATAGWPPLARAAGAAARARLHRPRAGRAQAAQRRAGDGARAARAAAGLGHAGRARRRRARSGRQPGLASLTAGMLDEGAGKRSALADRRRDRPPRRRARHGRGPRRQLRVAERAAPAPAGGARHLRRRRSAARASRSASGSACRTTASPRSSRSGTIRALRGARASTTACSTATGHPYGRRLLGTEPSVRALTRADLKRFHETWYTPDNAALIVVGDISAKESGRSSISSSATGSGRRPPRGRPRPSWRRPKAAPARVTVVDRPGAEQSEIVARPAGRRGATTRTTRRCRS